MGSNQCKLVLVVHLHLTANFEELEKRYKKRKSHIQELTKYGDAKNDPTESNIEKLATIADAVIRTDRCTSSDILLRALAQLKLVNVQFSPCVDVVVGGQYGSEGKGDIVAYIASEYDMLIRVGGPNAGHIVYEEPRPYTFHQLPSASRSIDASLIIGPGAVINLETLLKEIRECDIAAERLSIDPQSLIIESADIKLEKTKQKNSIGSTAQGVGAASARRILKRGDRSKVRLASDIQALRPFVRPTVEQLANAYASNQRILLEGTQGTSLSIFHGHYPHVTSRDTTVAGCLAEAGIAPAMVNRIIMVCRTYPIRVGDPAKGKSGPMSQQIHLTEIAERSGIPYSELRRTERTSTTNRPRRVAKFDWQQLRTSTILNQPTDIASTFVDHVTISNRSAQRYEFN